MHLTGNPNETNFTRLTLNWQPPRALNGPVLEYRIFYSTNSSAVQWKSVKADGSSLTKEISGLKPGTAYFFKMQARTKKGWGPMSSPKKFSTLSSKCSVCNCSILGCFPFVRTDRPGHSLRNENFTLNQSYPARSVKSQIVITKEIVFHQKLMEKAYFIFKMTGTAMVQPASSDFWKAPLVRGLHLLPL